MSVYSAKRRGWRYDFTLNGVRHTGAGFKTKAKAKAAEAEKRKEIENPIPEPETSTDTAFLDLVNLRLDHVKAYNSESHYRDVFYHARRWIKAWGEVNCSEISRDMIEGHLIDRSKISRHVANKDLQYIRALFNFGIERKAVLLNPTAGIPFMPIEKRKKYVPSKEDVLKVISAADPDTQHYLWTILLTAGRVSEINQLTWDDVSFSGKYVTLWTRKRKGGHREPREIPMVKMLYDVFRTRHSQRDNGMPWVFWHRYWSRKSKAWAKGPYEDRKKIMRSLCTDAKVRYFRYHALRHLTASILDDLGVPIGVIQRILGHQNRKTTEIYLHSVGEAERSAMGRLEKVDIFANGFSVQKGADNDMPATFWQRKAARPTYDVLTEDVKSLGYSGTGRKYGVSDNAIRKWMKSYETSG
jgi:integrase